MFKNFNIDLTSLFQSKRKTFAVVLCLAIFYFICLFFLHQYLFFRIIAFTFLLTILLIFISIFEYNDFLTSTLYEKDKKTQQEIDNKTKELEALTQLLTAKNKELEKRNYELQKHELTALKIMEEMDISNWKLKRQSQILEDAKTQLEKRTKELSILYELSNSMGYVSDYENLFLTIFSSITKASRLYAVSMLLFSENKNYLFTSVPKSKSKVIEKIENDILNALHPMMEEKILAEDVSVTNCHIDSKKLVKLANEDDPKLHTLSLIHI